MRSRATLLVLLLAAVPVARAQEQPLCPCPPPSPPPPAWTGSVGAGLALTSGNSDTSSVNVSLTAVHDPKRRNRFLADGLYLRSSTEGETSADRTTLGLRDEYRFGKHAYVFGEARYLRDQFKDVDYLISPQAGVGYRVIDTPEAVLSLDASLGGAFERLHEQDSTASGALGARQALSWKLTPTASLSQAASGLWKTSDFDDAYYHFEIALAASINKKLELKVSFADDYKAKPATPGIEKNDVALVAAVVYKL